MSGKGAGAARAAEVTARKTAVAVNFIAIVWFVRWLDLVEIEELDWCEVWYGFTGWSTDRKEKLK